MGKISHKAEILGDLKGIGLGRTALNDARAEAAYLLEKLPERLKGYDASLSQLPTLRHQIHTYCRTKSKVLLSKSEKNDIAQLIEAEARQLDFAVLYL